MYDTDVQFVGGLVFKPQGAKAMSGMCVQLGFTWETTESWDAPERQTPVREVPPLRKPEAPSPQPPVPRQEIPVPRQEIEIPVSPAPVAPSISTRQALVESLQARIAQAEGAGRCPGETQSTGSEVLDRLLPQGGLARGMLVEWVSMNAGATAGYLAMMAAGQALRLDEVGGVLVVLDRHGSFYPPAAVATGISADRLVILRPQNDSDAIWAFDQALRSPAVSCVWGELPRLDDRAARRLQLAAEQGPGLGLLVRPPNARHEPSWAEARWHVTGVSSNAGGRRLKVELVRCRGGKEGATALVEIDDTTGRISLVDETPLRRLPHATGALRLAAQLAHPAASRRADKRKARSA